ncbi:Na antiporter NhaA 2 protein [Marine Group I thaumarchaeote SCGC RSA3]|uniref:Na antiporter NhaA 2 protein n=3 Tax=Marine Group I TaxID=905826 RepID=A0A081RM85_9ARCH|nr:Na antiporter NhaA 2 protein [Marine Group I thaumarchaeote SCGC AAA799-N04]KFM15915.1 Na antiporter NhaA 2 protein [Marine Group I thaumarchaeote SCGC AAA799-D11]KFM17481.1 Na antiporter NhaA 2 protein [Marine Group I thaumarchaeote SCGC RSA3]
MEDFEFIEDQKPDKEISVSKSTFNRLIVAIVAVSIVSAFLGGYVVGGETAEPKEVVIREAVPNLQPSTASQQQFGPQIIRNISFDDDPMKGNLNASITIVEFSDFQCPFCAKFHETTLPLIEQNYIQTGKVNFVYRDFPIQNIHPNAVPAALASECADDQGKFWKMHDMIFEDQQIWKDLPIAQSVALYKQYASELGLDSSEFDSCLDSGKYIEEIQNDLNDGRTYGVSGTPGFFVGNADIGFTPISGAQPYSTFQRVIDGQLNR